MRSLTVTVDARLVFDQPRRGIAKTAIALYRALATARQDWRFVMFHRRAAQDNPFSGLPNILIKRIEIRGDKYQLWDKVRLPGANLVSRPDIFHTPGGLAPQHPMAPLVATVHDLIPLDMRPDDDGVARWAASVRRSAENARLVLTASNYAREQIIRHFAIPREKIAIIHWGPITALSERPSTEALASVRHRYDIPADAQYVLHFGMQDRRKNTKPTIEAWARVPAAVRERWTLLIVGVEDPVIDEFRRLAASLGVGESVKVRGYVAEEDVGLLLAGAGVMCYPTAHEGFGLPILDGFASDVPVLTGHGTSLPEVAGDAAMMVDVASTQAIADGLTTLLADDDLRREMVRRGRQRVGLFNWKRTAEDVASLFERVADPR